MKTYFPPLKRKYQLSLEEHYLLNVIVGIIEKGQAPKPLIFDLLDLKTASGYDFPVLVPAVRRLRSAGIVHYSGQEFNKAFTVDVSYLEDYLKARDNGGDAVDIIITGTWYEHFLNQKLLEKF